MILIILLHPLQWKAYKKSQEPKKMGVPTMDLSGMTEAERRELGSVDSEIGSGSDEDYEFYVEVT